MNGKAEVVISVRGACGQIVLNRPERLNALTLEMFEVIEAALSGWREDPSVDVVTIRGNGRAFCAGGDVRLIRDAIANGDFSQCDTLHAMEYRLLEMIEPFPKPIVSLIDGVCMGAGFGLAIHGSHRILTKRAIIAMPETAIGMFPDVGCSFVLPRLAGALGTFIGLTGYKLTADDALYAGLATSVVGDDVALASIENQLADAGPAAMESMPPARKPETSSFLEHHRAEIDRCFELSSVRAILNALEAEQSPWASDVHTDLEKRSPFALEVTLALLRVGSTIGLAKAMALERKAAQVMIRRADFSEGIRAVLIDRDNSPNWSPPRSADVDLREVTTLLLRLER